MSDTRTAYSADDVARAIGATHLPTSEQRAVIEAPLAPSLVVAGAGSGKTETMAARVVWLVANGHVEPDEVLGLTFTRKAASELAERIARRLTRLRAAGLWQPRQEEGAEVLGGSVTVSTYHSYAGRLVREHALRLGREPESRLLTEAAAWQYAAEAVSSYDGPMDEVDKAESTVTAAVVHMAGQLAEHLQHVDAVEASLAEVTAHLGALPKGKGAVSDVNELVKRLAERRLVLPIVRRFDELKRSRDAMDFADQMALAARLAREFPEVGVIERTRFRAVLLDEFQDTSEAQLELLRALYAVPGHALPVTAVGDPNQSIYGWRGASATTLRRFPDLFGVAAAGRLALSTSWRNDTSILDVANRVAAPLRPVVLRPRPGAGAGSVAVARLPTAADEAAHVADWVAGHRRAHPDASAAILCRKRSQFTTVIDALEAREIPYEVVGLGGLLTTPEVEDVVALLHVVADPARGDHLMRLLTGPLVHLGAADLDGLATWARHRQHPGGFDRRGADLAPDSADEPSLVEALTDLPPPQWSGPAGERLGAVALERLRGLATVVERLRRLAGLGLAELVGEAERALGLDIEVLSRPEYTPAAARAHLDAFADVAAGFAASSDRPTLGGFLAWLDAALAEERGLDKGYIEAASGAVQVMTVHSAKGLEWDVVAVPGLVESSFPQHSGHTSKVEAGAWVTGTPTDKGWFGSLAEGGIPYALRGDRDGLPVLAWRAAPDLAAANRAVKEFVRAAGERGVEEERRLAYVAFTRARHATLLTAHVWGTQKTPRVTSRFLLEVLEAAGTAVTRGPWADLPPVDATEPPVNPAAEDGLAVLWPADPMRPRRRTIQASADRVRAAVEAAVDAQSAGSAEAGTDGTRCGLDREIDLLLAERDRMRRPDPPVVDLPVHLSTSDLVALAGDRDAYAMTLRRPVPTEPTPTARRGTAFHSWVEQHYSRAAIVDVLDLPGSADEDAGQDADLPRMQANFLASPWAGRVPLEVETPVETVIGGIALRGRIDAVFVDPDRGADDGPRFVVVDWKTGHPPSGERARVRALQLAAYALAYARLRAVDPSHVRGAFFHALTGETVYPPLADEAAIAALLAAVPQA